MKVGNMSQTVWRRSVLKQLNIDETYALLRPVEGERCTAARAEDTKIRVSATAEVTGTLPVMTEYALLRAVNDVVCRGGKPRDAELRLTFPPSAEEADVRTAVGCAQMYCEKAGLRFIGVQAQVNPAVNRILASVTVSGLTDESGLVRMQDAAAGQEIVLCGYAGLEGSLQILEEHEGELKERFVPAFVRQMKDLKHCLEQAEVLQKLCIQRKDKEEGFSVFAMQQAAGGGVFAALWELGEAAGIGFEIDLKKIPIRQETVELCEYYQLNPYQMTSAGCILLLTDKADALVAFLEKQGVRAGRLGITTEGKARVITSGEEQRYLERPAPDERMRFLELESVEYK